MSVTGNRDRVSVRLIGDSNLGRLDKEHPIDRNGGRAVLQDWIHQQKYELEYKKLNVLRRADLESALYQFAPGRSPGYLRVAIVCTGWADFDKVWSNTQGKPTDQDVEMAIKGIVGDFRVVTAQYTGKPVIFIYNANPVWTTYAEERPDARNYFQYRNYKKWTATFVSRLKDAGVEVFEHAKDMDETETSNGKDGHLGPLSEPVFAQLLIDRVKRFL